MPTGADQKAPASNFGKWQVCGRDQCGSLGALGDHLKQELGSDVGQWRVADFIEYDHVVAQPALQHPRHRIVLPGFDQLVHEISSGGESRSSFLPTCCSAQARLAGTAFAHPHHGFSAFDVAALAKGYAAQPENAIIVFSGPAQPSTDQWRSSHRASKGEKLAENGEALQG
jgi:hypothetical protein